jgi:cytochrome P450
LAFTPFLGGKRICLGKTLVEVMVRFTIPLLFYHFDFEYQNPAHKVDKPFYCQGAQEAPQLPLKMTIKNKI